MFYNRAEIYLSRGQYDLAIQDINQSLKLKPDNAFAHNNRGVAFRSKGDYERAIQDFDLWIKLEDKYHAAYNNRCWARAMAGYFEKALEDCDAALKLKPNDATAFDGRGFAQLRLGLADRAIEEYNSALQINPNGLAIVAPDLGNAKGGINSQPIEDAAADFHFQGQVRRRIGFHIESVLAAHLLLVLDPVAFVGLHAAIEHFTAERGRATAVHADLQYQH